MKETEDKGNRKHGGKEMKKTAKKGKSFERVKAEQDVQWASEVVYQKLFNAGANEFVMSKYDLLWDMARKYVETMK